MDTASDQAFTALKGWMSKCSDSHEPCRRLLQMSQLPTRIVEIIDSKNVRLRETRREHGLYTCLSHCWGAQPIIRTTTTSLSTHLESIPWTDLPRTFQDAIDITSGLGIRHIWIDSLCIIQDDLDDWRHEGSRMCDIYSKSHLTIAASKSEDSTGGCYAASNTVDDKTHWFENSKNEQYNVHVRTCIVHLGEEFNFLAQGIPTVFPLTKRAWVFQERLLSPRVVHFGPTELYWECSTGTVCECSDWNYDDKNKWLGKRLQDPSGAVTAIEQCKIWHSLVEEYTKKDLQYDTDIFPALQGIAKLLQHQVDYFAGVWNTDTILLDLLWHVRSGRRPAVWRAPTWSWASIKGEIGFFDLLDYVDSLASVVDIRTNPLGTDPFGQLLSGHLELKGFLIEGLIEKFEECPSWCLLASSVKFVSERRIRDESPGVVNHGGPEDKFGIFSPDCREELTKGQSVKIMAVATMSYKNVEATMCLAFVCADPEKSIHTRVGLVTLPNDAGSFERFGTETVLTIV
ncbi:hypothetical protein OPT61_g9350 [Boeremia exigua]|uniref:Uncharacterized protein n=1 Tax=Boeremia exigua TaxID=749465 RepID=A0ACC2HVF7_9PLEO|nr:hypothetical protein OPT61_g9350 [Boeremia exigua]